MPPKPLEQAQVNGKAPSRPEVIVTQSMEKEVILTIETMGRPAESSQCFRSFLHNEACREWNWAGAIT
jgi:hypothetical protein